MTISYAITDKSIQEDTILISFSFTYDDSSHELQLNVFRPSILSDISSAIENRIYTEIAKIEASKICYNLIDGISDGGTVEI